MSVQPKKNNHRLRWVFIVAIAAALFIGSLVGYARYYAANHIASVNPPLDNGVDEVPSCGANATQLALGSPYRGVGSPASSFATDGSDVYISARHFDHGTLDPKTGFTNIWIGSTATPPNYNEQSGQVANAKVNFTVMEGKHKRAQLPAGRYWLWTSTGGDIVVASCGQISGQQPNGTTAPVLPHVYHGGACDDQAYYTKHVSECAVQ